MSNLRAYLCGKYWFSQNPYDEKFPLTILYFSSDGIAIRIQYDSWYKDTAELFVWAADDGKLTQMFLHDMRRQESAFDIQPNSDGGDELNLKMTLGTDTFFGARYIDDLSKHLPCGGLKRMPKIQLDHQGILGRLNAAQRMYGDSLNVL